MKPYRVVWQIDVEANTPREAAKIAQSYQRDHETWANVFEVFDNTNGDAGVIAPGFEEIDLDDDEVV